MPVRRLWQAFVLVLAAAVLAELGVGWHPHFAVEEVFGFNALYGLLSCAALILIAKAAGLILKRRDDYYDE